MGDSAGPSSRPAAERALRLEVSLQRVQTSFEQAVNIVLEELNALKADHAQLQSEHSILREEHKELQEEYETQKESWRDFKVWWKKTTEKKKAIATQQTPSRPLASSPLMSNMQTPEASSAFNGNGKAKLSKAELGMLNKVGLDCSAFATPTMVKVEPSSTIKVKREDVGVAKETPVRSTSPIADLPHSRSEGALQSEQWSAQNRKRPRSSVGADDNSSPSRRALRDIGNRSVSDGLSEEHESPAKHSSRGLVEEEHGSSKKRGRGRYSTGRSGDTSRTINDEFEVNPDRNGNVSFLHKSVVRDKAERKQMHAHDCECCSAYYKAVGEAPLRRYQDPRKTTDQQDEGDGGSDDEGERSRQVHRQQISRHRGYGPPANTPPGYWDTGFPSTQKQEEINRLAREEHAKKRDQIARDPRFKKRV